LAKISLTQRRKGAKSINEVTFPLILLRREGRQRFRLTSAPASFTLHALQVERQNLIALSDLIKNQLTIVEPM
jgi:hypothetical protein